MQKSTDTVKIISPMLALCAESIHQRLLENPSRDEVNRLQSALMGIIDAADSLQIDLDQKNYRRKC